MFCCFASQLQLFSQHQSCRSEIAIPSLTTSAVVDAPWLDFYDAALLAAATVVAVAAIVCGKQANQRPCSS